MLHAIPRYFCPLPAPAFIYKNVLKFWKKKNKKTLDWFFSLTPAMLEDA